MPSRPIDRGRPGPGFLAHVLVSKYADHLPLYRQSQILDWDGIDARSTLADWVGKATALLDPLADAIGRHVWAGSAIHADDTPPAAWYRFSVDRKAAHPVHHLDGFRGFLHADGYAGFNDLYRKGAIREVACMAHIRRKFVDVHQSRGSAIAAEAITRIAALYAVEKRARGSPPDERIRLRQAEAVPVLEDLEAWPRVQLARISGKTPPAAAIRYTLTRIPRLRPYFNDGPLELDNNTADRGMRGVAVSRKNWLFAGSEGGGNAAAITFTLIETAKLNGIDPQAWLTSDLGQVANHKITRIDELLPWRYAATAA